MTTAATYQELRQKLVTIGLLLRQERLVAGISQQDIVKAIQHKYDQSNIARMETGYGISVPKLRLVLGVLAKAGRKLAEKDLDFIIQTFGCKLSDLLDAGSRESLFGVGKPGRRVLTRVAAQSMTVVAAAEKLEKIVEESR